MGSCDLQLRARIEAMNQKAPVDARASPAGRKEPESGGPSLLVYPLFPTFSPLVPRGEKEKRRPAVSQRRFMESIDDSGVAPEDHVPERAFSHRTGEGGPRTGEGWFKQRPRYATSFDFCPAFS
jgi:hypothetical protein